MPGSNAAQRIHRAGGRKTVVDLFLDNVRERAGRCFVRFGGREFTYGGIGAQVERLAAALAAAGVARGDRVAIAIGNRPAFLVAFFGVLRAGATAVPLNILYKADEYRYALEHAGCAAVLTEPALAPRVGEALAQITRSVACFVAATAEEGAFTTEAVASHEPARPGTQTAPALEDLAGVFYTSGTTARPKGVMISHGNMIYSAETTLQSLRLGRDDVPLLAFPLFHVNSLFYGVFPAVVTGGTIGLLEGFSVSRYWSDAIAVGTEPSGMSVAPAIEAICASYGSRTSIRSKSSPRLSASASSLGVISGMSLVVTGGSSPRTPQNSS